MISPKEVRHIAKLARIGLSDLELVKFQKELAAVLDYLRFCKKLMFLPWHP